MASLIGHIPVGTDTFFNVTESTTVDGPTNLTIDLTASDGLLDTVPTYESSFSETSTPTINIV